MIELKNTLYNTGVLCKYLGVLVDNNLSFHNHTQNQTKMGRHCGVISKMRQFVPKSVLLKYYNSNIKPTMHYDSLVYGGTSFTINNQLLTMQRKIVRIFDFKKNLKASLKRLLIKSSTCMI